MPPVTTAPDAPAEGGAIRLSRGAAGAADVPMLDLFAGAGVLALIVLPPAAVFLPKLRLAPRVAMH